MSKHMHIVIDHFHMQSDKAGTSNAHVFFIQVLPAVIFNRDSSIEPTHKTAKKRQFIKVFWEVEERVRVRPPNAEMAES